MRCATHARRGYTPTDACSSKTLGRIALVVVVAVTDGTGRANPRSLASVGDFDVPLQAVVGYVPSLVFVREPDFRVRVCHKVRIDEINPLGQAVKMYAQPYTKTIGLKKPFEPQ